MGKIRITDDKQYRKLKLAFKEAWNGDVDIFEFEGDKLLVKYAKYLIEYIEMQRKAMKLKLFDTEKGRYGSWV